MVFLGEQIGLVILISIGSLMDVLNERNTFLQENIMNLDGAKKVFED